MEWLISSRVENALLVWKASPPPVGPKPYHLFLEAFTSTNNFSDKVRE